MANSPCSDLPHWSRRSARTRRTPRPGGLPRLGSLSTRACGEEADLRLLDAVLRLAALAVQLVVQRLRAAIEVGDDEARVAALLAPLQPRDDRRSCGQLCAA